MQALRNDLYRPWFVGEKDWGFEILDGEYSGIVVQIESVEFSEKKDGTVDLEYHIIKQPEDTRDLDLKGDLFARTVEIIINDILREAIDNYEQTRNNDSAEPSSQ